MTPRWGGVAGKRVLVTGATSGIGLAAARALAAKGARLVLVARSEASGREAASRIDAGPGGPVEVLTADLSSLASVRALAREAASRFPDLQVLVNNAGAVYPERRLSPEGFELTWAVNHLAPFLLTALLRERLEANAPARVVTTSSGAHKRARIPFDDPDAAASYSSFSRYGASKLANILFTAELARKLAGTGVTANCFHPGVVATRFGRDSLVARAFMTLMRPILRTPEKGAETLVYLADAEEVSGVSGAYFYDRRREEPSPAAQDAEAARRLWELSARQAGL